MTNPFLEPIDLTKQMEMLTGSDPDRDTAMVFMQEAGWSGEKIANAVAEGQAIWKRKQSEQAVVDERRRIAAIDNSASLCTNCRFFHGSTIFRLRDMCGYERSKVDGKPAWTCTFARDALCGPKGKWFEPRR